MKGLLKKDLLLLKSQIKYIVTIVVICLIMAYANSGFASISSYGNRTCLQFIFL